MCTISSQLFVFIRSRLILLSPTPVKWPWPSMKPGIAIWPARSMTCVDGPTNGRRRRSSDGDDRAVARGQRLRLRARRVERDDAAAAQHEIRRRRRRRRLAGD